MRKPDQVISEFTLASYFVLASLFFNPEYSDLGSYQLLSDGHLDLILDKCSDYWDGQSLRRMTDAVSGRFSYILFVSSYLPTE